MLLSSVGYGAEWKCVGVDANGTLWIYDTQNVSYGHDTTKVWGKRILGDKCKKENIKDCPITLDIEKVSYIKDKFEINCSKNVMRLLSSFWYDSKKDLINSTDYPDSQFHEVVPDSMGAKLVEILCKKGEGGK